MIKAIDKMRAEDARRRCAEYEGRYLEPLLTNTSWLLTNVFNPIASQLPGTTLKTILVGRIHLNPYFR